jgi:hypothetical protein
MTLLAPPKPSLGPEISPEKQAILDLLGFEPTGPEQAAFLASDHRFKAGSGGDQSGKSTIVCADCALRLPIDLTKAQNEMARTGRAEGVLYWLVGANYGFTRKEFEYLQENFRKLGLPVDASKRVDPGTITVNTGDAASRITIHTKSGTDPRGLAMEGPHGIVICEAGLIDFETWQRLLARAAPRRAWIDATGSLESSIGFWPSILNNWKNGTNDRKSFVIPSPTNIHVYPGGYDDPEILRLKEESSDEFFLERIMGQPVPPKGLVYHEFDPEIHVRDDIEWESAYEEVLLFEDPGYGQSPHALLAGQDVTREAPNGQRYHQIQFFWGFYEQGFIQSDVIDHVMMQPWWKSSSIYLVSDPYYKDQHHSMDSVSEQWSKQARLHARGKRLKVKPGIERVKSFLKVDSVSGQPRAIFSSSLKGVLSEFGAVPHPLPGPLYGTVAAYRNRLDNDGNIVGELPEKKHDHALDALRNGLVHKFGYASRENGNRARMKRW